MRKSSRSVRNLRTRSGCSTCRQRKVKCGEERPVCYNCQRLNRVCIYGVQSCKSPMMRLSDILDPRHTSDHSFDPISLTSPIGIDWLVGEWGDPFDCVNTGTVQSEPNRYALDTQQNLELNNANELKLKLNEIQIPFVTPFDSPNWRFFTMHASILAVSQPTVALCVSALEQMSLMVMTGGDSADALPQYFAARTAFISLLKDPTVDIEIIFVATFLLCCSEVLSQQDTTPVTLKQKDGLVTRIEQEIDRPKSPIVRRIIAWLHLFHAKAAHFGGRGLLSPRLLELFNDEDRYKPPLSYLSFEDQNINLTSLTIHQELFQFYYTLQHISIRASRLNRHHRSRVTIDDEIDVASVSHDIERRLKYTWESRPAILKSRLIQLADQDHQIDAETDRLAKLCILTYYAEVIYHARANGRSLDLSPDAVAAKSAIRSIIIGIQDYDSGLLRDPALIWPLFQYGIESMSSEEVEWAMLMMQPICGALWHANFFKDFVRALTTEQLKQQKRVDSRIFCIDSCGMSPPFM